MNIPSRASSAAAPAKALSIHGWPLLRLGFRPFYLGAALLAALAVPLWVAVFLGPLTMPTALAPALWHAHEMLFGFAATVIVGFLLTAGQNWTGLPTPRGPALGALALLWLAARLAALHGPYLAYAALDLLLLPTVAVVLTRLLLRAGNRRNLPLALILALLSLANLAFHGAVLGWVDVDPVRALQAALALIVMVECVMAGRVVPAFTMSATPGLKLNVRRPLELASVGSTAVALALWALAPPNGLTAIVLAVAALLQALRQLQWQPLVTRGRPILWILHAAYAWIPLGLALLALSQAGIVNVSAGVHALAVGATGGLIIGMITRTARGHTGRPLAPSRLEVLAYALVMAAALVRVWVPMLMPDLLRPALVISAAAWSAAFASYLLVFAPWLTTARLDGKDG